MKGNVTNFEPTTPLYPAFDELALNVIKKSPKWQPALSHNHHVSYRHQQAINFSQE